MRSAAFYLIFCLTTIGLFTLGGCASASRPKPSKAAAVPAEPRVVGEVAVVDEEKGFVLIDLQSNLYVPLPGTKMRTKNAAGETAHLKASPEQKRPFIAADILDGDPAVGDEVLQ